MAETDAMGSDSEVQYLSDESSDDEMGEGKDQQPEMTDEQKTILAENKKNEGNTLYKQQKYDQAIKMYNEAIALCPTCAAYYGNRSATHLMLMKYQEALDDARKSIQLDSTFVRGYLREAKSLLMLGDASSARRRYETVMELDPANAQAKNEIAVAQSVEKFLSAAEKDFEQGDHRRALYYMDQCIKQSPGCLRFKIMKAEALTLLERYGEAQEIANDVIRKDGKNADAIYVRGMVLYYEDNIDKAFQHFQHVLRLAPDHVKAKLTYKKAKSLIAKKEEGNKHFRAGKLQAAYKLYTEALEIDPYNKFTNSKLYNNRATVLTKQNRLEEAIEDCTSAIKLDKSYVKAFKRRGKCYLDTEKYEEAVRDYEKVFELEKTRENKQLLQQAKLELKKSKRKDYYKILGVHKNATDDEIKKAYRKRAMVHHPDRHSHDTAEKQKEEEKIFKEIGEAYSILSDAKKKARYDNGHDLDSMDDFGGDFDPNHIFQTFFGGSGGFQFGGFPHHQAGGFPGFHYEFH